MRYEPVIMSNSDRENPGWKTEEILKLTMSNLSGWFGVLLCGKREQKCR